MSAAVYRVVEHDGGWAYKLGDVFSETYVSRAAAEAAAERVVAEQRTPGEDEAISWQDEQGRWHEEVERGSDRPWAYVAHEAGGSDTRGAPRFGPSRAPVDRVGRGEQRGARSTERRLDLAQSQTGGQPVAAVLFAGLCGYGLAMLLSRRR